MEIRIHFKGFLDLDIFRQPGIEGGREFVSRYPAAGIKNSQIAEGVHTGVGPAGSDHFNVFPCQTAQDLVQDTFHRTDAALLGLKSREFCAVIGCYQ